MPAHSRICGNLLETGYPKNLLDSLHIMFKTTLLLMEKYVFVFFVYFFGLLPSSLAIEGAEEDKLEAVYLWRDSLIGQTIKAPLSFIAIHHTVSASVPEYYLKTPFLSGQKCSHTADQKFFGRVAKILAPNTSWTIKKIFFTMSKKNFRAYLSMKWLLRLLSLMEWHKFRGGANFYYLIQDNQGESYIIDSKDITTLLLEPYLSQPIQKAQVALTEFQQIKEPTVKSISITWEGHAEYIDKCQYYQSPEELTKAGKTEIKEQQKSSKRILELIQKAPPDHLFKNQLEKGDTLELQVNEKALALLLLNSSFLRIKDIKVKPNYGP